MKEYVQEGNEKWRKWARNRLRALRSFREDLKLPQMQKSWVIDSTTIHVRSSEFGDTIMILGPSWDFAVYDYDVSGSPTDYKIATALVGETTMTTNSVASGFTTSNAMVYSYEYPVLVAYSALPTNASFDIITKTNSIGDLPIDGLSAANTLNVSSGFRSVATKTNGYAILVRGTSPDAWITDGSVYVSDPLATPSTIDRMYASSTTAWRFAYDKGATWDISLYEVNGSTLFTSSDTPFFTALYGPVVNYYDIIFAKLRYTGTDGYDFYINGTLVHTEDDTGGAIDTANAVKIVPYKDGFVAFVDKSAGYLTANPGADATLTVPIKVIKFERNSLGVYSVSSSTVSLTDWYDTFTGNPPRVDAVASKTDGHLFVTYNIDAGGGTEHTKSICIHGDGTSTSMFTTLTYNAIVSGNFLLLGSVPLRDRAVAIYTRKRGATETGDRSRVFFMGSDGANQDTDFGAGQTVSSSALADHVLGGTTTVAGAVVSVSGSNYLCTSAGVAQLLTGYSSGFQNLISKEADVHAAYLTSTAPYVRSIDSAGNTTDYSFSPAYSARTMERAFRSDILRIQQLDNWV